MCDCLALADAMGKIVNLVKISLFKCFELFQMNIILTFMYVSVQYEEATYFVFNYMTKCTLNYRNMSIFTLNHWKILNLVTFHFESACGVQ